MRKNTYESVVIINAALEDSQVDQIVNQIQESITTHGGDILEVEKWGRKRLAYAIKKAKSGYYVVFRFSSSTDFISVLERNYRLEENIYRYLTIALDKFALEAISKQKEAAAKAVEVEAAANQDVPKE